MRRIVVLGTGFAGLTAAQTLERTLQGRRRVQLTVVTDRPKFLFTPLLPNVANGELSLGTITAPLQEQLDRSTNLCLERIQEIDAARCELRGEHQTIPFDYLILAPGSQTNWMGKESWRPWSMTCKSAQDAVYIRDNIQEAFAQAAAMSPGPERSRKMTFVFAGAGATGVELASELFSHYRTHILPKLDEDLAREVRFLLIEPSDTILPGMPAELSRAASHTIAELGLEIVLQDSVIERDEHTVYLKSGLEIPCTHFFWCAGVRAPTWLEGNTGLSLAEDGRVRVDETLQAIDARNIFAAGDVAQTPWNLGQSAQAANQQGPIAAKNLIAQLSGRTPRPFSFSHQGDLITLGRPNAAVSIRGVTLEGKAAYALYRLVYASLMPGSLKKVRIITEWLEHDLNQTPLLT